MPSCPSALVSAVGQARRGRVSRIAVVAAAVALALPGPAQAGSGAMSVRYVMSVAGISIGTATLKAMVADGGAYQIRVSAKVGGVMALISDGRGTAAASGKLVAAALRPEGYALNSMSASKQQTVQMALAGNAVSDVVVKPELPFRPDRIPVTGADKRGVIDPLSAMLVPVAGNGPLLSPEVCSRTLPVFDGAQRFNVMLSYARTEQVDVKGYAGPAVVCAARYVPIAGHRPDREQTKFMVANRDMEIWLAPVAGTRVLAPARIVIATQVGRLIIEAAKISQGDDTLAN